MLSQYFSFFSLVSSFRLIFFNFISDHIRDAKLLQQCQIWGTEGLRAAHTCSQGIQVPGRLPPLSDPFDQSFGFVRIRITDPGGKNSRKKGFSTKIIPIFVCLALFIYIDESPSQHIQMKIITKVHFYCWSGFLPVWQKKITTMLFTSIYLSVGTLIQFTSMFILSEYF